MSLTLGEKLRQAREERGFTLSEVAEQTRISSLYLESIESDDYRILPGGIFNKGFVKSFAKFVGINEQEALADYTLLIAQTTSPDSDDPKVYRPQVLTDDRSGSSMVPTVILAVVILGAMTAGILFLVNYLRQPSAPAVANNTAKTDTNTTPATSANNDSVPVNMPDMATVKVEFKALSAPVSLTATSDGKTSSNVVTAGSAATFEPKESLKLSYSKSLANVVQLTINGKTIALPAQPVVPKRNVIEFEINKANIGQIWTSGAISADGPTAAPDANASTPPVVANTAGTTAPVPIRPTPVPRPNAATNTLTKPTPERKPVVTPAPPAMLPKAANKTP